MHRARPRKIKTRYVNAMSILTPDQVGQLLAVAGKRFQPLIALCAFAGLHPARPAESS